MEQQLILRGVGAAYDGKSVLEDVSLEIPAQRITAIIGPSGCGKTSLLRCMNGLLAEEPNARMTGELLLDGRSVAAIPRDELRRRMGLVFQTPAPFPFSIYKNMTYAPKYYGVRDKAALDALVRDKLGMAGLYEEVKDELDKSALKLSGGQQQRLCIARALTVEPEVLLLDEPCSALDVKSAAVIEALLLTLKERYTIVVVTHNIAQARRIADYAAFLFDGHLVEAGPSAELFGSPREAQTKAFLEGAYG